MSKKYGKVALIGKGSIGSRYAAILDYYKIDYWSYESPVTIRLDVTPEVVGADYIIIATPTDTHYDYCIQALDMGKTFLVEKPVSRCFSECKDLSKRDRYGYGFVVNNYYHAVKSKVPVSGKGPGEYQVTYDYYNTGKDGLWWDVCQLLYLDPDAKIAQVSPRWNVTVDGVWLRYRDLENGYCSLIQDFCSGRTRDLWTLNDGLKMSEAVLRRIKYESFDRHTGTKQ